jgi:hypothetical protein
MSSRAEQFTQLRLADEDHLQQLARGGLEIGEQPHLFEHVALEQVCLVDEHRHAPPGGVRLEHAGAQRIDQRLHALAPLGRRRRRRVPRRSSAGTSVTVTRGLRISAMSTSAGSRASNDRTTVVLPVPTSPVSWMKPPAALTP